MISVKRYGQNPILLPNKEVSWEQYAVLNGSIVKKDDIYHMVYRAISNHQLWQDEHMQVSSIGHATSRDGYSFENRNQFIIPEYEWERFGCEDPRVVFIDNKYYIFYTAIATNPPGPSGIRIGVAVTSDFLSITEKHLVTPFNAKAMSLFPEKINGKYCAILTVDTDNPPAKIAIAQFDTLETLWDRAFWHEWYKNISEYTLPLERRNTDHLEVGVTPLKTKDGWLLLYSYIQNYFTQNKVFGIEGALLALENPLHIVSRTNGPIMVPEAYPELYGTIPNIIFPSGGIIENDTYRLYYGASDTAVCTAEFSVSELLSEMKSNIVQHPVVSVHSALHLTRFEGNPILIPTHEHPWEEMGVFNAGVFTQDKKIYIVYRGVDKNMVSRIGLAITTDGFHIDEKLNDPIYVPREEFEKAGCEDPRLIHIGDRIYMHYTAYNGEMARVARTSILVSDFLSRKWNWEKPQLLSSPSVMDKNSAVFPEKIQGKHAVLHRLDVRVWIDFIKDFPEIKEGNWLSGKVLLSPRPNMWDSEKVGIAGPPILTELGWLLIYHGISQKDQRYRIGIVVLDTKDPTKILLRLNTPILEPKLHYENNGVRPGAIFSCGSALLDNTLFVYYGAGDWCLGVARINYNYLLEKLKSFMEAEKESKNDSS